MLNLELENKAYSLTNWSMHTIEGPDSERFLNGQLSNDVKKLHIGQGQFTARVNRTGTLLSFGYLFKKDEAAFLLLCPLEIQKTLIDDLNKFIIMDDVEISEHTVEFSLVFMPDEILRSSFQFHFLGLPAGLTLIKGEIELNQRSLRELSFKFGMPQFNKIKSNNILINQTVLVDTANSRTKGCFIGQETINKIENNRGAGSKEVLISISPIKNEGLDKLKIGSDTYEIEDNFISNDKIYLKISAKRELRVEGKKIELVLGDKNLSGEVKLLPLKELREENTSQNLFESGINLFTQDRDEEAKDYLILALLYDPTNTEILESLGALEGRLGNYDKAIDLMNKLEELDPDSVMACTNRSLYYMKQGKIEEAEEEKSKATLKSFGSKKGNDSDTSKNEDMLKRLDMYEQVLEIDEEDEMANQGAALINFTLNNFEKSKANIEQLLSTNPENEKALSLMAKILIKDGEQESAKEIIDKVISIASVKGDFMLANEFQSLANSLMKKA